MMVRKIYAGEKMMGAKVEEDLKILELKKKKLRIQEKLLKERDKKRRARLFSEIGRLAGRIGIDEMEKDVMLGAFLEMSEKMKVEENIRAWKKRAVNFLEEQDRSEGQPLAIAFRSEPRKEIREQLKARKFKWNSFRKEFYGHGKRNEIAQLLEGAEFEMEVVA